MGVALLLSMPAAARAGTVLGAQAAPGEPDERAPVDPIPPDPSVVDGAAAGLPGWLLVLMALLAAANVTLIAALRLYTSTPKAPSLAPPTDAPGEPVAQAIDEHRGEPPHLARLALVRAGALPLLLLVAFLAITIASDLGALSAAVLMGTTPEQGPTLRDYALPAAGRYVGGALGVLFVCLTVTPVARLFLSGFSRRAAVVDTLRGLGWLLLLLPLLAGLSLMANQVAALLTGEPAEEIGHDTLALIVREGGLYSPMWWLLVACVTIGAPLLEEILYRGCLQSALRRMLPGWGAILGTSLLFAAIHYPSVEPQMLAVLFVLSLGFGLVYERRGSLLACVVMHAGFNALNVAVAVAFSP